MIHRLRLSLRYGSGLAVMIRVREALQEMNVRLFKFPKKCVCVSFCSGAGGIKTL